MRENILWGIERMQHQQSSSAGVQMQKALWMYYSINNQLRKCTMIIQLQHHIKRVGLFMVHNWTSTHNHGRRSSHLPPVTNSDETRIAHASNSKLWQRIKSIIVTGNHPDRWVEVLSYTDLSASACCDSSAVNSRSTWCTITLDGIIIKKTTAWRWTHTLPRGAGLWPITWEGVTAI